MPGLYWGEWGIVGRSGRVWCSGVEPGEMVVWRVAGKKADEQCFKSWGENK
nr:hypothetical protein [Tanacetum cinerariifolium]